MILLSISKPTTLTFLKLSNPNDESHWVSGGFVVSGSFFSPCSPGASHQQPLLSRVGFFVGKTVDFTGRKFGRLTVAGLAGKVKRVSIWDCVCECGNTARIRGSNLTSGCTKSCGCLRIELLVTHGSSKHPLYGCWKHMLDRCENPKSQFFHRYGGRGVSVCERWHLIGNFINDMGERPSLRYSVDRFPDKNGNYEPGNCRWATDIEQNRNTRRNRLITAFGETKCIADWADDERNTAQSYSILQRRISVLGWPPEIAISAPKLRFSDRKGAHWARWGKALKKHER